MANTAEFYRIRSGQFSWALISLHEATGAFLCHSDFGSFCYTWPPQYRSESLKRFLSRLDRGYFMEKTRGQSWMQFSPEATLASMYHTILRNRRDGSITREAARKVWDALRYADDDQLGGPVSVDWFLHAVVEDDDLRGMFGLDLTDLPRNEPAPDCAGFWTEIWPKFLEQIAPEIEAEAA